MKRHLLGQIKVLVTVKLYQNQSWIPRLSGHLSTQFKVYSEEGFHCNPVLPSVSWYEELGHSTHSAFPIPDLYFPGSQAVQLVLLVRPKPAIQTENENVSFGINYKESV